MNCYLEIHNSVIYDYIENVQIIIMKPYYQQQDYKIKYDNTHTYFKTSQFLKIFEQLIKITILIVKQTLMAKYNLAVDSTGTLNDFMEQQGVDGIPHAFLFDKTGALVWQGHPMDGECADKLKELAGKK
ncbi:FixW_protein [Hexamita inflata]|uniref:Putative n=1 Tax=Hexamita inflata TaxID=28002 RepID=A0ABP1H4L0_9EUKA